MRYGLAPLVRGLQLGLQIVSSVFCPDPLLWGGGTTRRGALLKNRKAKLLWISNLACLIGDPRAVTKIFIVSCATDSYEMCFCGTVPQIVVHFDLSGSKCGTKTASFKCL